MRSRRPRFSKSPKVFMVVSVLALTLRAARDSPWFVLAIPGVFGLSYLFERRGRARAIRALTPSAGGNPAWLGRVHPSSLWIWPDLPLRWWSMHDEGLPARLEVSDGGITVTRRRFGRPGRESAQIPWNDIAGARARDRGHRAPSGSSFTTLRRTDITVDVIGGSAENSALPAGQPADSEGTEFRTQMDAQIRAIMTELATRDCPDWRPGTAPLVFITAAPDGLLDRVLAGGAGRS